LCWLIFLSFEIQRLLINLPIFPFTSTQQTLIEDYSWPELGSRASNRLSMAENLQASWPHGVLKLQFMDVCIDPVSLDQKSHFEGQDKGIIPN
jgi:hypothetical protein